MIDDTKSEKRRSELLREALSRDEIEFDHSSLGSLMLFMVAQETMNISLMSMIAKLKANELDASDLNELLKKEKDVENASREFLRTFLRSGDDHEQS